MSSTFLTEVPHIIQNTTVKNKKNITKKNGQGSNSAIYNITVKIEQENKQAKLNKIGRQSVFPLKVKLFWLFFSIIVIFWFILFGGVGVVLSKGYKASCPFIKNN